MFQVCSIPGPEQHQKLLSVGHSGYIFKLFEIYRQPLREKISEETLEFVFVSRGQGKLSGSQLSLVPNCLPSSLLIPRSSAKDKGGPSKGGFLKNILLS